MIKNTEEKNINNTKKETERKINKIKLDIKLNKKQDLKLQNVKENESENSQVVKDKLNEVKNNKNSIESEIKSFKDKTKELEKQLKLQKFQLQMAKLNKDDAADKISSYQQESKHLCIERSKIEQNQFKNQTKISDIKTNMHEQVVLNDKVGIQTLNTNNKNLEI